MSVGQESRYADVVIVGAGPAGLAAALEATEGGASVLLVDERAGAGGQIWRNAALAGPPRAQRMIKRVAAAGVDCAWGASVVRADAENRWLQVSIEDRSQYIRFGNLILATGARELFLPFPGWTLPGVVGVGGLQAMIKSGAKLTGQRVLIAGSGPLLLPVAALARQVGAHLVEVAEQTPASELAWFAQSLWQHPDKLWSALSLRTRFLLTPYRAGRWVRSVSALDGDRLRVRMTDGKRERDVECDLLAASYGLVPAPELGLALRCEADSEGALVVDSVQRTSVTQVLAAGEVCGVGGSDLAIVEGRIAGAAAVGRDIPNRWIRQRDRLRRFATAMSEAFAPRTELSERMQEDTLVCRCEDIPWGAVESDAGPRATKLMTRCGMGLCQGRTCMPMLKALCDWTELPVVRPPIQPLPVSALMVDPPTSEPPGRSADESSAHS